MTYIIDARLERGAPSLTLIDAVTGEERLHWRCGNAVSGERAWQNLFKQLVLLSCAERSGRVCAEVLRAGGESHDDHHARLSGTATHAVDGGGIPLNSAITGINRDSLT